MNDAIQRLGQALEAAKSDRLTSLMLIAVTSDKHVEIILAGETVALAGYAAALHEHLTKRLEEETFKPA